MYPKLSSPRWIARAAKCGVAEIRARREISPRPKFLFPPPTTTYSFCPFRMCHQDVIVDYEGNRCIQQECGSPTNGKVCRDSGTHPFLPSRNPLSHFCHTSNIHSPSARYERSVITLQPSATAIRCPHLPSSTTRAVVRRIPSTSSCISPMYRRSTKAPESDRLGFWCWPTPPPPLPSRPLESEQQSKYLSATSTERGLYYEMRLVRGEVINAEN